MYNILCIINYVNTFVVTVQVYSKSKSIVHIHYIKININKIKNNKGKLKIVIKYNVFKLYFLHTLLKF